VADAYVVWTDAGEIYIWHSADSGASFAAATNVSSNSGASDSPSFTAQASPAGIHLTWVDAPPGNKEILDRFGSSP
jgi:hypothetical protein